MLFFKACMHIPRFASGLNMPNRLERIERSMETFANGMESFGKGMNQHMLLISEVRELVKALLSVRES